MSVKNAVRSTGCDVIIINLNEIHVVKDSIRRLKKEGHNVIVVDNGSDGDDVKILEKIKGIELVEMKENNGVSVGRNAGLELSTADFIFLLDGDVLYVPGTIKKLIELIPMNAACLGVHNVVAFDGTMDRNRASVVFPEDPGEVRKDFAMAWTQYGLFRGAFLRRTRFVTEGAFGEAGSGFEDDWLYHEMLAQGLFSYYVSNVLYYHDQHSGVRYLKERKLSLKQEERKAIFKKKWNTETWQERKTEPPWIAERMLTTR